MEKGPPRASVAAPAGTARAQNRGVLMGADGPAVRWRRHGLIGLTLLSMPFTRTVTLSRFSARSATIVYEGWLQNRLGSVL